MLLEQLRLPYIDAQRLALYFTSNQIDNIVQTHAQNAIMRHAIAYCRDTNINATVVAHAELDVHMRHKGNMHIHWHGENAMDNAYIYAQHIASRRLSIEPHTHNKNGATVICAFEMHSNGESAPDIWDETQKRQYANILRDLQSAPSWVAWTSKVNTHAYALQKMIGQPDPMMKIKWSEIERWNLWGYSGSTLELFSHPQIDRKDPMTLTWQALFHYMYMHGLMHIDAERPFALCKYATLNPLWNLASSNTNTLLPQFAIYMKNEFNIDVTVLNVYQQMQQTYEQMAIVLNETLFSMDAIDAYIEAQALQPEEFTDLESSPHIPLP